MPACRSARLQEAAVVYLSRLVDASWKPSFSTLIPLSMPLRIHVAILVCPDTLGVNHEAVQHPIHAGASVSALRQCRRAWSTAPIAAARSLAAAPHDVRRQTATRVTRSVLSHTVGLTISELPQKVEAEVGEIEQVYPRAFSPPP